MDRRDFFGIVAAPLLRLPSPPVPMSIESVKDAVAQVSPAQLSGTTYLEIQVGNRWQRLGEVTDISGPAIIPTIGTEQYRGKMSTLLDRGKISLDVMFEPLNGD